MKFSIIFPTRDRVVLLGNLFISFVRLTKRPDECEFMIAVDEDDKVDYEALETENVHFYRMPRSDNFSRDYFNALALKSTGEYVMAFNDDVEFRTKDWDEKVYKQIKNFEKPYIKDYLIFINDVEQKEQFPSFPMLPRNSVIANKGIFNEEIPTWGADRELFERYLGKGILRIKDVNLYHNTHHYGRREKDKLTDRVESIYKGEI